MSATTSFIIIIAMAVHAPIPLQFYSAMHHQYSTRTVCDFVAKQMNDMTGENIHFECREFPLRRDEEEDQ